MAQATATLTGKEVIAALQSRSARLAQRLASLEAADRRQVLGAIQGRGGWPKHLTKLRRDHWEPIDSDVKRYAESFAQAATASSVDDYAGYLRRVVLARLSLEELTAPAEAAFACETGLITSAAVDTLRRTGFVLLDGVLERAGLSAARLHADLALLHKHGVITPSPSSCNPGAHGVMLRCGSPAERAGFERQGTTELLRAVSLLRALPSEIQRHGYPTALQLPPTFLASAYPPGAQYQRHLDNYGADNARALTLILYANPDWAEARRRRPPRGGGRRGGRRAAEGRHARALRQPRRLARSAAGQGAALRGDALGLRPGGAARGRGRGRQKAGERRQGRRWSRCRRCRRAVAGQNTQGHAVGLASVIISTHFLA